jgi:hypothetical protein
MSLAGITRPPKVRTEYRDPGSSPVPHSGHVVRNLIHLDVVGPDANGNIVTKQQVRDVNNIMATFGLVRSAKFLSTGTDSASLYASTMAIGTDSTAAASTHTGLIASTQLCGTFSKSDVGNMTARYLATFASDGNSGSIREVGIFATNNATQSMICRSALTGTQSVNRGASDQINVTYDIVHTTA